MESNNEYNVPNGEGSRIIQNNNTNYNERDNNLIITGNVLASFKCDLGGHYEQKLSRPTNGKLKSKGSKKIGYEWQINLRKCKKFLITLIKDIHNHDVSKETIKFAPVFKDIGNAVKQQYNNIQTGDASIASSLLIKLLQLQHEDSSWFVKLWIDDSSHQLIIYILYIYIFRIFLTM
ncbi:unnamed protein product [Rhizophagus irregularis]|nr:unnamed protein product [Rhizophagus irregularis]